MKTAKITAIIIAFAAIILGVFLCFSALFSMKFDFNQLNTITYTQKTYNIEEDFTKISIDGAECDIRLIPSDDDRTTIQCSESDKIYHNVKVENDTLKIIRIDSRKWFEHFGIYWAKMEISVHLPKDEYDELYAKTLSGNIDIPENFKFAEANVVSTSGDVNFSAEAANKIEIQSVSGDIHATNISADELKIQATSGDIELLNAKIQKNITLKTVSGEIEAEKITCHELTANSTSGTADFEDLIAENEIKITTVSGGIYLENSDGETLKLKSTSGNIYGKLRSGKNFYTDTVSGSVNVPRSDGGHCDISTISGNIHMEISGK